MLCACCVRAVCVLCACEETPTAGAFDQQKKHAQAWPKPNQPLLINTGWSGGCFAGFAGSVGSVGSVGFGGFDGRVNAFCGGNDGGSDGDSATVVVGFGGDILTLMSLSTRLSSFSAAFDCWF